MGVVFGDREGCISRVAPLCKAGLTAPGSLGKVASRNACRDALENISCNDFLDNGIPVECLPVPGKVEAGKACSVDPQCKSNYCKMPIDSTCGVCATKASVGGACVIANDCEHGLTCHEKKCVTPAIEGARCSKEQPCRMSFVCKGEVCAKPSGVGEPCKVQDDCDSRSGLYCAPASQVCVASKLAKAGEPCGFKDGFFVICGGGSTCKTGKTQSGVCEAAAADGAACDPVKGPSCLFGAKCEKNVCTVPNPAICK
jgi:hypothetical protein